MKLSELRVINKSLSNEGREALKSNIIAEARLQSMHRDGFNEDDFAQILEKWKKQINVFFQNQSRKL